jgi:FkbM family methyltransferase
MTIGRIVWRCQQATLKGLRKCASLPLRALNGQQRAEALQALTDSMVSEVKLSAGTLRYMTPTPLLLMRANATLSKEPDTLRWIDSFECSDVFWDIGANVGVFSLYAARQRRVRVLAFEPSADNYMVLCRNVEINSFDGLVLPFCVALAGSTKLGVLNSPTSKMGASLHQFGDRGETSRYWNGGQTTSVQGMVGFTIDDFIQWFQPPFPTRLKLDVDGLEWAILQGARRTLCDKRLRSIMA